MEAIAFRFEGLWAIAQLLPSPDPIAEQLNGSWHEHVSKGEDLEVEQDLEMCSVSFLSFCARCQTDFAKNLQDSSTLFEEFFHRTKRSLQLQFSFPVTICLLFRRFGAEPLIRRNALSTAVARCGISSGTVDEVSITLESWRSFDSSERSVRSLLP